MSSPAIDYNALAKQAGAISSTPTKKLDYAALAKQAGATSSTTASGEPLVTGPHEPDVQAPEPSLWSNPREYLQNRAKELGQSSQDEMNKAFGIESQGRGWVNRLYHRSLSLLPETGAVVDKAAAGLMDWKNAAVTAAGAFDPALPAAYFMTQGADDLAGISGPSSVKRAFKNPTPENVQQPLLSAATVAGAAPAGVGPKSGTALRPGAAISRAALLGRTPAEAYESALKPSTTIPATRRASIVQTGLDQGIPVSKAGMEKIDALVNDLNQKIDTAIPPNSPASVNKFKVAGRLNDTAQRFSQQVNPTSDLEAIGQAGNDFLETAPNPIPAKQAQAMKVGTYQQLRGKYGELKSASIEAQKALARGLREEIAQQFPELNALNKAEGGLLELQPVLERAVNRISNHQLVGIGTPITTGVAKVVTGSTKAAAIAGLMKAVLDNPTVKSRLAISLSKKGIPLPKAQARVQSYVMSLGQAATGAARSQNGEPIVQPEEEPTVISP